MYKSYNIFITKSLLLLFTLFFLACNTNSNNKIFVKSYGYYNTINSDYSFIEEKLDWGSRATFYYITKKNLDSLITINISNNPNDGNSSISKEYYLNNILIKSFEFDMNGNKTKEIYYEYDMNGNITKFEQNEYNNDGSIKQNAIEKTEYVYDKNSNWITRKSIDGLNNTITETSLKIIYKGEDLGEYYSKYPSLNNISFNNISSKTSEVNKTSLKSNSTTESNNNYTSQSNTNNQQQRKCYKCNGTGKCSTCMRVFRIHYWAGKGPGWKNENQTRPGQVMCEDCFGAGVIYGRHPLGEDPEYKECYVSACNGGWKTCQACNYGGNGRNLGQCSECEGKGYKN